MSLIILIVIAVAALIMAFKQICRMGTHKHPVLRALQEVGAKPGGAEYLLCRGDAWVRKNTLMTAREQHFFKQLSRCVDENRWRLCPQVRLVDIVGITPKLKEGRKAWWSLFSMASQWHCDVVIVDKQNFSVIAVLELDDASHQKQRRKRRDILFNEVLRQAGVPLLRDRDVNKLISLTCAFLQRYA